MARSYRTIPVKLVASLNSYRTRDNQPCTARARPADGHPSLTACTARSSTGARSRSSSARKWVLSTRVNGIRDTGTRHHLFDVCGGCGGGRGADARYTGVWLLRGVLLMRVPAPRAYNPPRAHTSWRGAVYSNCGEEKRPQRCTEAFTHLRNHTAARQEQPLLAVQWKDTAKRSPLGSGEMFSRDFRLALC
ncbi:hypothetical protein DFH09DRAFT_1069560 [Mycena vulgaris]|nr:hypothetical protein DFH09DRAFT_1069560 [Mycena vulgaris]